MFLCQRFSGFGSRSRAALDASLPSCFGIQIGRIAENWKYFRHRRLLMDRTSWSALWIAQWIARWNSLWIALCDPFRRSNCTTSRFMGIWNSTYRVAYRHSPLIHPERELDLAIVIRCNCLPTHTDQLQSIISRSLPESPELLHQQRILSTKLLSRGFRASNSSKGFWVPNSNRSFRASTTSTHPAIGLQSHCTRFEARDQQPGFSLFKPTDSDSPNDRSTLVRRRSTDLSLVLGRQIKWVAQALIGPLNGAML